MRKRKKRDEISEEQVGQVRQTLGEFDPIGFSALRRRAGLTQGEVAALMGLDADADAAPEPIPNLRNFNGGAFAVWRRRAGVTQKELSAGLTPSVDFRTISDWERGRALPSEEHAAQAARDFGCDVLSLFIPVLDAVENAQELLLHFWEIDIRNEDERAMPYSQVSRILGDFRGLRDARRVLRNSVRRSEQSRPLPVMGDLEIPVTVQMPGDMMAFNSVSFGLFRKRAKLTQKEVGSRIIPRADFREVSLWERGKRQPTTEQVFQLSSLLEIAVPQLLMPCLPPVAWAQSYLLNLWAVEIWEDETSSIPYYIVSQLLKDFLIMTGISREVRAERARGW